jgi:DNA-binding transcriptional LysR family regulator
LFGTLGATLECDDFDVLRKVVLNTDAIWLTSARLSPDETASGQLVEIIPPCGRHAVLADIVLVRVGSRSPSRAAGQIMETAFGIFA